MKARASVNFKGKVQGVFFRANTRDAAVRFGVVGWVMNLPDGSVGAVFEGEKQEIENLIDWCKRKQPHAHVDSADVRWEEYIGEFRGFNIRY
ncbi:MAG: acylphosphatase [Methanomassiliicoccales archaeon]|nr:MAG: acylphosphatase [Methanomassiliicoccales archaeon]